MRNQCIPGFKSRAIIMATMVAVGSTMTMASTATAVTLKVSLENLGPNGGALVTPLWFGFHDGSFDTFNPGAIASSGIEHLAEDGFSGLEANVPGFVNLAVAAGLDLNKVPPQNSTISGLFAASSAGMNGGVQGLLLPQTINANGLGFFPGQSNTTTIQVDDSARNRFFSYGAMVIPTNDAFISNDNPIEIFDSQGKFIGADLIVQGNQVWDAGTEVNDESPSSFATLPNFGNGIPENGVVRIHPGLKPPGTGGYLDLEVGGNRIFANADFKAPGYQVARITVTEVPESVPEPATTSGLLALAGLFMLHRRVAARS